MLAWDMLAFIISSLQLKVLVPCKLLYLECREYIGIVSVQSAAKWVPSINKAVLRVCALYAASCSGISPGGLKWFLHVQCQLGEEGRVSTSVVTRL